MGETKRYRLPAELGGGEVEVLWPSKNGIGYQVVLVPGGGPQFEIHENWLTEVPPPVPDEPEPGAYEIGGVVCLHWQASLDGEDDWAYVRGDAIRTFVFEELWADLGGPDVRIVALVPKAEPVELPWRDHVGPNSITEVCLIREGLVEDVNRAVGEYSVIVRLTVEQARAKAAALLTAADRAEAEHG